MAKFSVTAFGMSRLQCSLSSADAEHLLLWLQYQRFHSSLVVRVSGKLRTTVFRFRYTPRRISREMLARNFPAAFPQPLKTPENPTTKILARNWLCVVWFSGTLVPGLVCLGQTLLSKINDGTKYVPVWGPGMVQGHKGAEPDQLQWVRGQS